MSTPRSSISLAFVHHANQYLIAEHYDNREGIHKIVEGYAAALQLHARYGVPANLHLSGTLIEAIAWHCPWFLALVRDLKAQGLIALIGGTYAENVMPLFTPAFNRRQLHEYLWLVQQHLHCDPRELQICWIPERVWNTTQLAPLLADKALANGGYRYVLLDDRLLYPAGEQYVGSARQAFDATGPFPDAPSTHAPHQQLHDQWSSIDPCAPYVIAHAGGLTLVPISAHLRYCMPPASDDHWQRLTRMFTTSNEHAAADQVLVYADDLEKTVGVGGWDPSALERFDALLQWVAAQPTVTPVLLPQWLEAHPARTQRSIEPGTFFELAHSWRAGEEYRGWWNNDAYASYRACLVQAQHTLEAAARDGANAQLVELAWKHLLACGYETAWHDPEGTGRAPAAWSKAIASHARACSVIVDAARWFAHPEQLPTVAMRDVDGDGEDEVVVGNEHLYAVISPTHGGRIVYMFTHTGHGGALVVGNPSDDWNFQQELNRYMDWPPNHPGALADLGAEHDSYIVTALDAAPAGAYIELTNVEPSSALHGVQKRFVLAANTPALVVEYAGESAPTITTQLCLSPDYHNLLRRGRAALETNNTDVLYEVWNGAVAAWVGRDQNQATEWVAGVRAAAGHGFNVGVAAHAATFHLLLGCGAVDGTICRRLLDHGKALLHELGNTHNLVGEHT